MMYVKLSKLLTCELVYTPTYIGYQRSSTQLCQHFQVPCR